MCVFFLGSYHTCFCSGLAKCFFILKVSSSQRDPLGRAFGAQQHKNMLATLVWTNHKLIKNWPIHLPKNMILTIYPNPLIKSRELSEVCSYESILDLGCI